MSGQETEDDYHGGDNQQQVDKPSRDAKEKATTPKENENCSNNK
jgi:hypothetical protein